MFPFPMRQADSDKSLAFFLRPALDGVKHHKAYLLSQHGSEPETAYSLHHLDPASQQSKNCYAAALFDAYNPDVLFGEILVRPEWTQPSLSQEDIRKNGGVPPPPQLILPTQFTIQLYEPDQQIVVTQKSGSWGGSSTYEFTMPQNTFRTPSASSLDRSLSDPVANATTPRLKFVWRREGKLSKDFSCFLTGKTTDVEVKKKKEPDIAVALFKSLKEVTIYEPNLYRVEMEDIKGLEVVLLLGAAAIKDMYFSQAKETFNVVDPRRKNSGGLKTDQAPMQHQAQSQRVSPSLQGSQTPKLPYVAPHGTAVNGTGHRASPSRNDVRRQSLSPLRTQIRQPPPPDRRTEWEIDAETARLKAQTDAEAREHRRIEEARRRERQAAEEADKRRIQKLVEKEQQAQRRRQAEVDRETERLRRKYGTQENLRPQQPPRIQHSPRPQQQHLQWQQPAQAQPRRHSAVPLSSFPPQGRPSNTSHTHLSPPRNQSHPQAFAQPGALHLHPNASASGFFGGGGMVTPDPGKTLKTPKKSFWGLRSKSEGSNPRLQTKKSSMF